MSTFQRARTDEQREERRRLILDTAAAMLEEMPVAAITLNELSRRVGLAKSNVLRYFESREAVLLELLEDESGELLADLGAALPIQAPASESTAERVSAVAAAIAQAISARPTLCELLSAQAGVLEHNVSVAVAARYKRAALDDLAGFAALLGRALPELDERRAAEAALMTMITAGALWTYGRPAVAVRAAIDADESLAAARIPFTSTLERSVTVTLLGLITEAAGR